MRQSCSARLVVCLRCRPLRRRPFAMSSVYDVVHPCCTLYVVCMLTCNTGNQRCPRLLDFAAAAVGNGGDLPLTNKPIGLRAQCDKEGSGSESVGNFVVVCWLVGSLAHSAALRLVGGVLACCQLVCLLGGSLACRRHCGSSACCSLNGSLVAKGVVACCKSACITQSPFLLLLLHCATYVVRVVLLFFGFADAWCSSRRLHQQSLPHPFFFPQFI